MMKNAKIITYSGKMLDIIHPDPKDIDIQDIAHALAYAARFTGHTTRFLSVANHSVFVADQLARTDPSLTLYGLLHDASEAYIHDMATPIKLLPQFNDYRNVENHLMEAIFSKFNMTWLPEMPAAVRAADALSLTIEARRFLNHGNMNAWVESLPPDPRIPYPVMDMQTSEHIFMRRFNELFLSVQPEKAPNALSSPPETAISIP